MNTNCGPLAFIGLILVFFAFPANAAVSFKASYRESASRFQILDCVAQWWDHCTDDGEYRNEWIRRFGALNDRDLELFENYKSLREKYLVSGNGSSDPLLREDGFFARGSAAQEDPIQFIFFASPTPSEAFLKLEILVAPAELEWLKSFYDYFEPRTSVLLEESRAPFQKWASELTTRLAHPGYPRFFRKISAFFGVVADIEYEVLVTWWPPIRRNTASPVDRYLIFQKNPVIHMAENDLEIVFHEVVHTISARQPKAQKQELTRKFLGMCPVKDRLKRGTILEEPLAVALGQIAFLEKFEPKTLKFEKGLYRNAWISAFAKAIYPILKSEMHLGRSITHGFVEKAANQCEELVRAAELLKQKSD